VIFVTVGTQLAFDRLVGTIDTWCGDHPSAKVFAQVGPTKLKIQHVDHVEFLSPENANDLFLAASLIVAHAGMGSVLTALRYKKPILILPRKAALGEHRNEHQMATAKWLANRPGIIVAWDEREIPGILDGHTSFSEGNGISEFASLELLQRLKNFIQD